MSQVYDAIDYISKSWGHIDLEKVFLLLLVYDRFLLWKFKFRQSV